MAYGKWSGQAVENSELMITLEDFYRKDLGWFTLAHERPMYFHNLKAKEVISLMARARVIVTHQLR